MHAGKRLILNYIFDFKLLTILSAFFLLLFINFTIKAEKVVLLAEGTENVVLKENYFSVFEDSLSNYEISDVSKPSFQGFRNSNELPWFNKNATSAYWLRFKVKSTIEDQRKFLLETYAPHTNLIQVFLPTGKGSYVVQEGGENFEFIQRIYKTKNIIFDLPLAKKDSIGVYYIRILSENYSAFDFRIKTVNYFLYYITNEYYFLGIYYGILLIMAVYNLLIYFTVKEKVYLYYVFYVMCSALITMTDDGLGFQYLWPNFPAFIRPIGYTIAPLLLLVSFILYSSSFLSLKSRFPFYWKIVFGVMGLYFIYFILSMFFVGYAYPIVYTIPFLVTYGVACYTYSKGFKASRFFIIGYSFILVSIIIIQLRAEHILHGNFFTVYSLNIGLVFEVVIFSIALSDRIKIFKKEKDLAQIKIIAALEESKDLQEKVSRELEEKVNKRAIELNEKNKALEEVNAKLEALNDSINKQNAGLDYDNWHLKKDIINDLQARILEEEVPLSEFEKVFPDDQACLLYLAEQKWAKFYRCRKCGNLKSTVLEDLSKRKCSVCSYVESATAFTLYHGVRFSLTKAFYLTYLFYKNDSRRNLSEISDQFDISRNTSARFRDKVIESKEKYLLNHKNVPPLNWEDLIILKKVRK